MGPLKTIRRDSVSPCEDFRHALRVGAVIAALIFIATWGLS